MNQILYTSALMLHYQAYQVKSDLALIETFSPSDMDGVSRRSLDNTVNNLPAVDKPYTPNSIDEFNENCERVYKPFFQQIHFAYSKIGGINIDNQVILGIWKKNMELLRSLREVSFETYRLKDRKISAASTEIETSLTEYLNQKGLIGLPEDLDITLGPITARGIFAEEIKKRKIPVEKGIILQGPPGTGKTSFARHLAKFLGCEPSHVEVTTGSELLGAHVGETERNIRNLFKPSVSAYSKLGRESPLYMIIIDEFDSISGDRSKAERSWEITQVSQFLTCMDGYFKQENLLVIGLTNKIEAIDPALLRPGRFGTHIRMDLPSQKNRERIINLYLKTLAEEKYLDQSVNIEELAKMTEGYSGAALQGLVDQVNRVSYARFVQAHNAKKDLSDCYLEGKIKQHDFMQMIEKK